MAAEAFDEQLARRLTRALAADFLIDEWTGHSDRAAQCSARDVRGGAPVTVEILLDATPANERAAFRRDAERGVRLKDRLAHPNILTTVGAGAIGDLPYAATAPVDGRRLDELIESGQRLSANDVARVVSDLAHAVAHAHEEGITHGRIGPRHVVIDRKSRNAMLADFGADGGSVAGDLAQLGRAAAYAARDVELPAWLSAIVEKASRGVGGYHAAYEIIDDIGRHEPSRTKTAEATATPARAATSLHAPYVLARAAALQHQVTHSAASADSALKAFSALNVPATIESLDAAAFEAGIERRFVMLAAAENARGQSGESVIAARIVDASVSEVLDGMPRLSSPTLALVRREVFGGAPADGGIVVLEIPHGHPGWVNIAGALGGKTVLLSVTRASNGRDPRASDVVMSTLIDPSGLNGRVTSAGVAGGIGAAVIGGIIGAMLGGMGAALVTALLGAIIGAVVGGLFGRSSKTATLAAARRELSGAIDALVGGGSQK